MAGVKEGACSARVNRAWTTYLPYLAALPLSECLTHSNLKGGAADRSFPGRKCVCTTRAPLPDSFHFLFCTYIITKIHRGTTIGVSLIKNFDHRTLALN